MKLALLGLVSTLMDGQTLSFFRALPGPGPHTQADIMLVDGSGVYSFGDTIRKYDLDGAAVWSREHPRGETVAWLASTGAGVYAAGHIPPAPGGRTEAFVSLYDLQGNELWNRSITFANAATINRSVAADESGVCVFGTASTGTGVTYYLRKYDPRGAELWTKTLADSAAGIAVDSTGVYLRGASYLRKYDRNGSEVWTRAADTIQHQHDFRANATGVYETGYDGKAYFVARYDANGNQVWIRYGQSGLIALDADSVYVTAAAFREPGQCASGSEDVLVVRYGTDGKVIWNRQFGTYETEYPRSIGTSPNSVFVAGFGAGRLFLGKLDPGSATTATSEPRIKNECVVNWASNIGGAVSPGEIVTILGAAIGPSQPVSARADRTVETTLAETRVLFDGVPAPLFLASAEQVHAIVPNSVASKSSVSIQVEHRGALSRPVTLPVLQTHPGLFGVVNQDGNPNSPTDPARRGSTISIYGTGGGETTPATPDGQVVTNPLPRLKAPVRAVVESFDHDLLIEAGVTYAGAIPGLVAGLMQVNVRLSESLPAGRQVSLFLFIGDVPLGEPVRISLD